MSKRIAQALLGALFLLTQSVRAQQASVEVPSLSLEVNANKVWSREAEKCPSEVMPARETKSYLGMASCQGSHMRSCMTQCTSGDAGACYWLGQALQAANGDSRAYESLYQRACKLGVMSGCTNRAAGMLAENKDNAKSQRCAADTFAKACAFDDPWACTMYAFHLSRGIGVSKDEVLALKTLERSCKYGLDDEACKYGMGLRDRLLENKRGTPSQK